MKRVIGKDPQDRAVTSALRPNWTVRVPHDCQDLVVRAIRHKGRNKAFWVIEALRIGLNRYRTKETKANTVLK